MDEASPSKLATLKKAWQDSMLTPTVKRFPERRPRFTTSSDDIEVQPLYTPADVERGARWRGGRGLC